MLMLKNYSLLFAPFNRVICQVLIKKVNELLQILRLLRQAGSKEWELHAAALVGIEEEYLTVLEALDGI